MIYFIQAGDQGPIKIGFAKDPYKRLRGLQTGSPEQLEIIHTINGTIQEEQQLHDNYKNLLLHGEWFKYSGELRHFLNKCDIENTQTHKTIIPRITQIEPITLLACADIL